MLIGELVKDGRITRDHVVKIAEAIFDGKRELPLANGIKLISPDLKKLTPHAREVIITQLLTAEAISDPQA